MAQVNQISWCVQIRTGTGPLTLKMTLWKDSKVQFPSTIFASKFTLFGLTLIHPRKNICVVQWNPNCNYFVSKFVAGIDSQMLTHWRESQNLFLLMQQEAELKKMATRWMRTHVCQFNILPIIFWSQNLWSVIFICKCT